MPDLTWPRQSKLASRAVPALLHDAIESFELSTMMACSIRETTQSAVAAAPSHSFEPLAVGIDSAIRRWWKNPPSPGHIRQSVRKFSWSNVANAIAREYAAVLDHHRCSRN